MAVAQRQNEHISEDEDTFIDFSEYIHCDDSDSDGRRTRGRCAEDEVLRTRSKRSLKRTKTRPRTSRKEDAESRDPDRPGRAQAAQDGAVDV